MGLRLMEEKPAVEDSDLVRESLAGNPLSFQLLVERYQDRLFALARHYTRSVVEIEDIVQDAFLKAYSRLDSFQQQSSFYTWLYRIATNTILDWMKRRGRSPVQTVEDPELAATASDDHAVVRPESKIEEDEVVNITREVLDTLPEIFRTVLVMREFEDLSYQEIADVLEISIGTVESRLFRARAKFKAKLLQAYPEFTQGVI